jgi:hypothetical protein
VAIAEVRVIAFLQSVATLACRWVLGSSLPLEMRSAYSAISSRLAN